MWSKKPMPVAIDGRAGAVEIDRDLDVGFLGGALDRGALRPFAGAGRAFRGDLAAAGHDMPCVGFAPF